MDRDHVMSARETYRGATPSSKAGRCAIFGRNEPLKNRNVLEVTHFEHDRETMVSEMQRRHRIGGSYKALGRRAS